MAWPASTSQRKKDLRFCSATSLTYRSTSEALLGFEGRNDPHFDRLRRGFGDADKFPLRFEGFHDIRIVIRELFKDFPGKDFVVAGRNTTKSEVSVRIASRRTVEVEAAPFTIGNEYRLSVTHRLLLIVDDRAVNLASVRTDDNVERAPSKMPARVRVDRALQSAPVERF